jgi:hypothetical protein
VSNYKQFGFGDGDGKFLNKDKRLKLAKGEKARISFLWWPGLQEGGDIDMKKSPIFIGARRGYIKNVGFFIHSGPEFDTLPIEGRIGDRTVSIIVRWPLLHNGQPSQEGIREGGAEVMYLLIDPKKLLTLKTIHQEYPLGQHDIIVTCDEPNYQQWSMTNARESLLAAMMTKDATRPIVTDLLDTARMMVPDAPSQIGQDLTVDQIRAKLGMAPPNARPSVGGFASDAVSMAGVNDAISGLLDD